ncbi:class F sortase [Streptomyces sp. HMX112]|uniref:class F sortase n=1 Tax=Streptomyces sp. HMX112 TaxID=3390850 RepID=UPI003A7F9743
MSSSPTAARTRGWSLVAAAFAGLWLIRSGWADVAPPAPSAAEAFAAGPRHRTAAAGPLPPSAPTRVRIPEIGVDAPLVRLGLGPDGSLDVAPAGGREVAGWYRDGTPPGSVGTAIVAGHVDDAEGPAVFHGLGALGKGHRVEVARRDGLTALFTIDAVEVYDNDAFPDRKVYGHTGRAELRLITCGGRFDARTGYQGNVVVHAHLTGVRRAR